MFCKIFITYGKKWTGLQKYLDGLDSKHRIITTIEPLNDFLVKNNKSSETLQDKFPEISSKTREIYDNAHLMLENYRKSFMDLTYRQFELFPSIELLIFDDLVLLEKSKLILEEEKDTIFVFDRFSFAHFAILKLAQEIGYNVETGFRIGILQESKIKYLRPEDDHVGLVNRNKIHFLTTNFSKAALSGIVPYLTKSVISKARNTKSLSYMIQNTTRKISKMTLGKSGGVAFFFTTDIEDFLRPFYTILNQLKKDSVKFQIFSIDLSTKSILSSKKIPHKDLFQEVYLLAHGIKNSQDGTNLKNKLEKIAYEDNLTLIYFEKLSYFIESEIYRAAAIVTICDLILSKLMPITVGLCIDGSMYANSVTTVAKKHHILSISIEPGIVNEKLEPRDLYKADKICIYGLQGLEVLQSIGYSKDRIVVTGNPRYDFLYKLEQKKSRKLLSKIYHIDPRKKLITIAMGRWHENDEIWMSRFIKFCNINNIQIIIKVHPIYKTKYQTKSRKKIEFISKSCKGMKFHITYDTDSSMLISASDLIITDYSNVGVEAILLNKSIITVNFAKEDINNVQRYHEYNAAIYVDEYDKMEEIVIKILSGKDILAILQEGRNRLIPRYNLYNDGKANLRIIDLLLQREN